ncbi:histidine phosphatase family protein [Streptomonospora nanhaiensis]
MRHGTCEDGLNRPQAHPHPDSPLSVRGAIEAETAAHSMRSRYEPPVLVIPSPLRRARQTAAIVASALGARLGAPIGAFTEWTAPTCVLGRTPEEYPGEYRAWRNQRAQDTRCALPGGESLHAFSTRAQSAATIADDLVSGHGPVLIVSHRLLIGAVAALHLGSRDPVAVFESAKGFRLDPSHLWAPLPGSTHGEERPRL